MWTAKAKEDTELLALFEESGRNVQRASRLLRDLFAAYPERPELAGEVLVDACETVANVLEGITLKRAANGRH
jgi:hypothetical protein